MKSLESLRPEALVYKKHQATTPRKGFTLIELLVVIAIIAILAAILFPVFAQAREKARQTSCLSNQKQVGLSLMQYVQDFDGTYPPLLNWGVAPGWPPPPWSSAVIIQPYMKSFGTFVCPSDRYDVDEKSVTNNMSGNIPTDIRPPHHMSYLVNAIGPKWDGMFGVVAPKKAQGLFSYSGFAGGDQKLITESMISTPSNLIAMTDGFDELVTNYWGCGWWASTEGASFCYDWWNGPFEGITSDWLVDAMAFAGPTSSMYKAWHKHGGGANFMYADGHVKWSNPLAIRDAKYWLVQP